MLSDSPINTNTNQVEKHTSNPLVKVSTPGRIVLAGEHQDYFKLPVISAGISLRITITGHAIDKPIARLSLKNMGRTLNIPLRFPIPYRFRRSYLQSGLNNLHRSGFKIPGFEAEITSDIPQNSGLSSSSALCVAWARFLLDLSNPNSPNPPSAQDVAEWAHKFEVSEFHEPGGQQDHLATALGGIQYMDFQNELATIQQLKIPEQLGIVVGNSLIGKNTIKIIFRIRKQVINGLHYLKLPLESIDLSTLPLNDIPPDKELQTLTGIIKIRDITQLIKKNITEQVLIKKWGYLLTEQHQILRDNLQLSIPRIERMISNANDAGAYGAKINGSGGGGCMIAICPPEIVDKVAQAIQHARGHAYIVKIDSGVRVE